MKKYILIALVFLLGSLARAGLPSLATYTNTAWYPFPLMATRVPAYDTRVHSNLWAAVNERSVAVGLPPISDYYLTNQYLSISNLSILDDRINQLAQYYIAPRFADANGKYDEWYRKTYTDIFGTITNWESVLPSANKLDFFERFSLGMTVFPTNDYWGYYSNIAPAEVYNTLWPNGTELKHVMASLRWILYTNGYGQPDGYFSNVWVDSRISEHTNEMYHLGGIVTPEDRGGAFVGRFYETNIFPKVIYERWSDVSDTNVVFPMEIDLGVPPSDPLLPTPFPEMYGLLKNADGTYNTQIVAYAGISTPSIAQHVVISNAWEPVSLTGVVVYLGPPTYGYAPIRTWPRGGTNDRILIYWDETNKVAGTNIIAPTFQTFTGTNELRILGEGSYDIRWANILFAKALDERMLFLDYLRWTTPRLLSPSVKYGWSTYTYFWTNISVTNTFTNGFGTGVYGEDGAWGLYASLGHQTALGTYTSPLVSDFSYYPILFDELLWPPDPGRPWWFGPNAATDFWEYQNNVSGNYVGHDEFPIFYGEGYIRATYTNFVAYQGPPNPDYFNWDNSFAPPWINAGKYYKAYGEFGQATNIQWDIVNTNWRWAGGWGFSITNEELVMTYTNKEAYPYVDYTGLGTSYPNWSVEFYLYSLSLAQNGQMVPYEIPSFFEGNYMSGYAQPLSRTGSLYKCTNFVSFKPDPNQFSLTLSTPQSREGMSHQDYFVQLASVTMCTNIDVCETNYVFTNWGGFYNTTITDIVVNPPQTNIYVYNVYADPEYGEFTNCYSVEECYWTLNTNHYIGTFNGTPWFISPNPLDPDPDWSISSYYTNNYITNPVVYFDYPPGYTYGTNLVGPWYIDGAFMGYEYSVWIQDQTLPYPIPYSSSQVYDVSNTVEELNVFHTQYVSNGVPQDFAHVWAEATQVQDGSNYFKAQLWIKQWEPVIKFDTTTNYGFRFILDLNGQPWVDHDGP